MTRILALALFMFIISLPLRAEHHEMKEDAAAEMSGHEGHEHAEESKDVEPTIAAESSPLDASEESNQLSILERPLNMDIVYGEADAPVTIVEYASLSCPACRNFYLQAYKGVIEDYVKEGKVRLVYRHFPLNRPAFNAAMLVECVEDTDRQKLFLGALFKSQSEWSHEKDEESFNNKIKTIARIGGITDEEFTMCVSNKKVEDEILAMQLLAVKEAGVKGTPAIYLNGTFVPYSADIDEVMKRKIDAMLNHKASESVESDS